MAAPNRIYTLNLGTQTITLAEFQVNTGGGVILARYKQVEILGDPAADAARNAQTKLQVQDLVGEFGIKHAPKVNYSIASHVIFTRPVRLPAVGEAQQVEQIVGFEAAQNVPYPIDQVVWDWQLLDEGKGGQMEVILAAIKSDLLDEINASVQDGGLSTGIVDIAPMSLYNSLRYNYADADGCTLLVDIGSRTTNLLFCEPGKIFPRRLNLGGSTVTAAIAKDLGIAFAEADAKKAEDGFVSLGGSYAEPDDEQVARISKIIRNQMTRLHQEIARSITFYRSEHGGAAPSQVLLAGGTASLPYMREFFQEKFPGMEVDYFNPLRNVAISSALNAEEVGRVSHTLGEVVGLALRAAVSCPMELNLRPVGVVKAERAAKQRPFLIAAGIVLLAGVAAVWQYFDRAASIRQEAAAKLQSEISSLEPFANNIKSAENAMTAEIKRAEPLVHAVEDRDYWLKVIDDLNAKLPPKFIWITSFEPMTEDELKALQPKEAAPAPTAKKPPTGAAKKPDKDKKKDEIKVQVKVKGFYLAGEADNHAGSQVVFDFLKNLAASELVEPPSEEQAELIKSQTPDGQTWAYSFEFPLFLKRNPYEK